MNTQLETYLEAGVLAMARGGQHAWFDGHFGAAMLAAYYLNAEYELPGHVQAGLVHTCEHYRTNHPDWFTPAPDEQADPERIERVLAGLRLNTSRLSSSGHGLAMGFLALKALLDRPDLCLPSVVDGIYKMLERTANDRPNRYYGIADYQAVTPEQYSVIPAYQSADQMVEQAFAELQVLIPNRRIDGQLYHFTGEAEHGLTHAQALLELDRLGYHDIAAAGMHNHRIQMFLNRQRPTGEEVRQIVDPGYSSVMEPSYWERVFNDPHALKVPYAAVYLLNRLPEEKRAAAEFNTCKILCQMK